MELINLGLLAHVDAGKTTIVEQLLYRSGALREPGSVEKGNTQTDWLNVERERGISVKSSSVSLERGGVRINIIDTPGHMDFTGEVERALSVLDAAVLVVSAAEGIQSQTDIFWNAISALKMPAIVLVNKIDRAGCNPEAVLDALKREFSPAIIPINAPVGAGGRECSVRCVAAGAGAGAGGNAGGEGAASALSAGIGGQGAGDAHDTGDTGGADGAGDTGGFSDEDTIELCSLDGELGERYLSGGQPIGAEALLEALARQSKAGRAYPLLFGSASLGVGMAELLDAIPAYLPSIGLSPDGEPSGVIYKVEFDRVMGKTAHVRLFSGTLRNRDAIATRRPGTAPGDGLPRDSLSSGEGLKPGVRLPFGEDLPPGVRLPSGEGLPRQRQAGRLQAGRLKGERLQSDRLQGEGLPDDRAPTEGAPEKITQIRRISGARREDSGVLLGGDIAAVYGLSDARAGDVIGDSAALARSYRLAAPLFSVRASAAPGLENRLLQAIMELSCEDPLLQYEWEPDERELVVRTMGKIQLEILEYLLKERYGLDAAFSAPSVIYKETPAGAGQGLESYTMPKPCWAVVRLAVEPLPRGAGYRFESAIKEGELPGRYQRHVELSVPEALKQGLFNWEVVDLKVTLVGGQHHHVHTHPMDFFLATPIAVMKALQDASTRLLEPVLRMRLAASEELSGRLIGDIIAMRGEFDSPAMSKGKVLIEARVPVATSMDYAAEFMSLTSGKGAMRTAFCGYRECPPGEGAAARRRGINPLDRMKWILHKRSALS
ncbi:MAG: TetM/TetW/TetO/TetS family tetracycline resistance ribosomal protection protein [Clostridiales bacterium]|jgi:small GTP-binding protein|nr:TetM/TetW/TetO/TetS family tetracycline resistance ribosomal protection protein [Clostridiales bacterium]